MAVAEIRSENTAVMPLGDLQMERRSDARTRVACDLWMIGHESSTILRCRCDNAGEGGLHLVAPLGYGIAEGQRYELRSHPPGTHPFAGFGPSISRWARIVRTEILLDGGRDRLGVGVSLEPAPRSS